MKYEILIPENIVKANDAQFRDQAFTRYTLALTDGIMGDQAKIDQLITELEHYHKCPVVHFGAIVSYDTHEFTYLIPTV